MESIREEQLDRFRISETPIRGGHAVGGRENQFVRIRSDLKG